MGIRTLMTQAEWYECAEALKDIYNAQFFNCPDLECAYYCCPDGPIQTALCFCNPVSYIACMNPVERKREACVATPQNYTSLYTRCNTKSIV